MNGLPWLAALALFFAVMLALFAVDELVRFIRRAVLGQGGNTLPPIFAAIYVTGTVSAWITFFYEVTK